MIDLLIVEPSSVHGSKDLEQRLSTRIVLRSNDGIEPGAFELARAPAAA
ncbi:hypothetical protein [Candidatus Binatus sp.]